MEIQIPQVLVDVSQRATGIILLIGNRYSKMDLLIAALAKKWQDGKPKPCVFVVRDSDPKRFQIKGAHITNFENLYSDSESLKKSEIIFFEDIQFDHEFEKAIHLFEEGRMVLVHMSTFSILSALHRSYGLLKRLSGFQHWIWRLVEGLQLMVSQTGLPGVDGSTVLANEIVLVSPELKKILRTEDMTGFEEFIRNANEQSGILNLNQSLLQMLIRRKIELKTAFESTRDPDDLDQMLKKVGL